MLHATPFPERHASHAQPDVQWLERMYNNRLRVPEHGRYLARWDAESELARRSLACDLDVRYGDGPGETLDAYPAARARSTIAVFIHSDYWRSTDKSRYGFVAQALHALGAAVVVPGHAPAPRASVPEVVLQVAQAVAWSWRHARELRGNARRIVVIGHGAGGQLAAMMLACAWNVFDSALPPNVVRAALGISGLYDLQPLMHTPSLQEALRLTPRQVHEASPARLPSPAHGRLASVVGGEESGEYQRLNRLIQQAWGRERVPVAAVLPGLNHFSILDALVTPRSRLHRMAASLLA